MKTLAILPIVVLSTLLPASTQTAPAGNWRSRVVAFGEEHLKHPAWGVAHSRRDYELARELAGEAHTEVDDDVLFAAAWLHDIGAFEPFRQPDVDHADRASALVGDLLTGFGFPPEKIGKVRRAIETHMYSRDPGADPEAIFLHDADTLDFLGSIGIARILAITGTHRWASDLPGAVATIRKHAQELGARLVSKPARQRAEKRIAEMQSFLETIEKETGAGL
jgi:uncharacterized protein